MIKTERPAVRSVRVNTRGLVKVKFEKPMKFNEDFIKTINEAIATSTSKTEDFKVNYRSGYSVQDPRHDANVL